MRNNLYDKLSEEMKNNLRKSMLEMENRLISEFDRMHSNASWYTDPQFSRKMTEEELREFNRQHRGQSDVIDVEEHYIDGEQGPNRPRKRTGAEEPGRDDEPITDPGRILDSGREKS